MSEKLFNRNFVFLILGQVSSLVGNYTLKFALSMYVLEQTGSASLFAGLMAAAMLPTILLTPFGGILADRADRRAIMVALDSLSGLSVLLAALAFPGRGQGIGVIGALLVALSVLSAFESPTVQACVPQMLTGENVLRGNAMVSQVASLTALVTPFLGSLFYTAVGLRPVLYTTVGCFFLTALLECFIRLPRRQPGPRSRLADVVRDDFALTLRFMRQEQPATLRMLVLAALVNLLITGLVVVGFPYLVRMVLGLSANHYGAAESAMGVAAVLGAVLVTLLAGKMRPRHLTLLILLVGFPLLPAGAAFLFPLGSLGRYLVLVAAFCACQLGGSIFSTYAITLIQSRTPEQLMGKVMSCVYTMALCAQPLGQILYGGLLDRFSDSVHWVLLPSGLLVCLLGLAFSRFFRQLEH